MTSKDLFQLELSYNSVMCVPCSASSLALAPGRAASCCKPKTHWSCWHLKDLWRVMPRRQGPAWPTPDPFLSHPSHPLAHTRLSWDQEMPSQPCAFSAAKVMPVSRASLCKGGCRGATRLPTPPNHGQGTGSKLCPALPRQSPSQAGAHGIIAWFGGVWL